MSEPFDIAWALLKQFSRPSDYTGMGGYVDLDTGYQFYPPQGNIFYPPQGNIPIEIQDLENPSYSGNPYSMQSTQPEPVQSVNPMGPAAPPPVGSSGRLLYLNSKSRRGTLTPEEHREFLMLGGM